MAIFWWHLFHYSCLLFFVEFPTILVTAATFDVALMSLICARWKNKFRRSVHSTPIKGSAVGDGDFACAKSVGWKLSVAAADI
jgi:hypothetical protein